MNRKGLIGVAKWGIGVGTLFMLAVIFAVYVLPAFAVDVTVSTGALNTSQVIAQSNQLLNFSLVQVDDGTYNITNITIEIPAGFAFITDSNDTNATANTYKASNGTTFWADGNVTWGNTTVQPIVNYTQTAWFLINVSTPNTNGTYDFVVYTHDEVNSANATTMTITVTDNVAPVIYAISPIDNNWTTNGLSWTFIANLTEHNINTSSNVTLYYKRTLSGSWASSEVLNCYIGNTGAPAAPPTATDTNTSYVCNKTIDISGISLAEGENMSFSFNTTDLQGNLGANKTQSSPSVATLDSKAPYYMNYTSPVANNTNYSSNTVEFNFTVRDRVAPASTLNCSLYLNGSYNTSLTTATNDTNANDVQTNNITINTTDGEWIWNITCADQAGNKNTTSIGNYTIIVDTTPPTGTGFLAPTPDNETNTTNNYFYVNVSFDESYPDACLLELTNASGTANYTMTEGDNNTECYFNATAQITNHKSYFYIYTNDSAGNWNMSLARHVTFDNISPSNITYLVPANNTELTTNKLEFNFTVIDNLWTDSLNCSLYLNGSYNTSNITTENNTLTNISLGVPDGTWIWNITCSDPAGNTNTTAEGNRTILVDASASASFSFISPTLANNSNTSKNYIEVNVTFTEDNLDACLLELANSTPINYTMEELNTTTCWFNASYQPDGRLYYYYVYANDTFGNLGRSSAQFVTVDNINPVINETTPNVSGNDFVKASQLFQATLTEANIDYTKNITLTYKRSGATSWESPVVLNCFAANAPIAGGNESTSFVCNKTVDLSLIIGEGETLNFHFNTTDMADRNGTNGSASSPWSATADVTDPASIGFLGPTQINDTNLSQDNHMVNVTFIETNTDTVLLELTNTSGTINYTMTQQGTNATEYYFNVSYQSDNSTYFYVYVNDSGGNWGQSAARHVRIDTVAPTNFFYMTQTPTNDTNLSQDNFVVNITFTENNLDTCLLELINYTGTVNYTMTKYNVTDSTPGCFYNVTKQTENNKTYFYVYANSTGGNLARSVAGHVTFDNTTPSNVSYITGNLTNSSTGRIQFMVIDNIFETGLSCSLYLNDTINTTVVGVANNTLASFSSLGLSDGEWIWNITCNDSAGNTNTTGYGNHTLTYDATPPTGFTFGATTPNNDTNQSFDQFFVNITFTETYLDTCYLEMVSGNTTGGENITMIKSTNASQKLCYYNYTNITVNYANYFRVWANDTAGNWNVTDASYTRHITFDNTSPSNITYLAPANNTPLTTNKIEFNFTVIDNLWTNTLNCSLYLNGSYNTSNTTTENNTLTNITLWLADGEYIWNITCADPAGNTNTTADNYTVRVDMTAPTGFTFGAPIPNNDTNQSFDQFFVNITFTETYPDTCYLEMVSGNTTDGENITMTRSTNASQVMCYYNYTNMTINYANYFRVWANDTAGNWNVTDASYTRHIIFDNTSPSNITYITGNLTEYNTYKPEINFTVWDNLEKTISCALYLNDSVNASAVSFINNTMSNFTISTGDGTYVVNITCNDSAGNENTTAGKIWLKILDEGDPSVTIDAPVNASYHNGTLEINTTITDSGKGVDTAWFDLVDSDGNTVFPGVTINSTNNLTHANPQGGYNTTFDTSTVTDGTYTLRILANDTNNNTNQSEIVTIYIDNSAPGLMNWTYNFTTKNLTLNFNGTVDGTTSSLGKFSINNSEGGAPLWFSTYGFNDGFTTTSQTNSTTLTIALSNYSSKDVLEIMSDFGTLEIDIVAGAVSSAASTGILCEAKTDLTITGGTYNVSIPEIGNTEWATGWHDTWRLAPNTLAQIGSLNSYTVTTVLSSINNNYVTLYAYNGTGWLTYTLGDSNNQFTGFNNASLGSDPHYFIYMNASGRIMIV